MGDRANVKLIQRIRGEDHHIYLYTHWAGTELPVTLRTALRRGEDRWSDDSYLARVIFEEMIRGDGGITGFGICAAIMDNEHRIIEVDSDNKTVRFLDYDAYTLKERGATGTFTFAEYIALDAADLMRAYGESEDAS